MSNFANMSTFNFTYSPQCNDKLLHDLGKVIKESKDILDGLLNITMEESIAKSLSAWFEQICGLQGEIASVHFVFNGLYVAIPQGKLKFPTIINECNGVARIEMP
ncbi:hypothetical protein K501DRAFT_266671 [Backusella circina FSU 941]|nr:hypothetical protein K501DRAFT_266671 [Backusella circina FSU 941]